jgi:hypothetical protein
MIAWFHYRDTGWADDMLDLWIKQSSGDAVSVLELLLQHGKDAPHLLRKSFTHAVGAFLSCKVPDYTGEIEALAGENKALAEYLKRHRK